MCTLAGPTGRDCLAFGNDVLDRQSYVGECSAVEIRSLFFACGTSPKFGRRGVMVILPFQKIQIPTRAKRVGLESCGL
jgi:hypothetical protein